jgi:hypothetical protein
MPYKPVASVAGVSLRVTRLDADGNLLNGPTDSYLTTAFTRVSFTPEYEDGDEITEKAADGTVCVSFKAPDTLKRMNMEIAICDPDPEITALMSGGLILSGPDGGNEVAKGWASAQVGEDPSGNGVAVEVWSKAIDNGKESKFFHWVFPYVKTRLSGDRVIENGLLATSFEGFGLGNINFRNGPDGAWLWPAAADRPYLYARSDDAPQGLRGFYTYQPPSTTPGDDPAQPEATPPSFVNIVGVNVKGGTDPYPYDPAQVDDNVLSSDDFTPDDAGTATYPASADKQTVKNLPGPAPDVQNPVTYLDRGLTTPGATLAGGGAKAGSPVDAATLSKLQAAAALNVTNKALAGAKTNVVDTLAHLKADPTLGDGNYSVYTFKTGEFVVLGDGSQAHYTGGVWAAGAAT